MGRCRRASKGRRIKSDDERLAALGAQLVELRTQADNGRHYGGSHGENTRHNTTAEKSQRRASARAIRAIGSGAARRAAFLAELENCRIARTRRDDRVDAVRTSERPNAVRPSLLPAHEKQPDGGGLVAVSADELYRAEIARRRGTGKKILIPRDVFRKVFEGSATPDEIAIARNRTADPERDQD